ncbi:MAG TPA: SAM-dependent chlorinase/fluorinase [Longimicrobiaceae bacterium]
MDFGESTGLVSLLTDFGGRDHYVGTMKAVLLGSAPGVSIVDLGHEIPPGDVEAAAFSLLAAYPYFPAGTVHVVVVDPGVGSERRVIVVEAAEQRFVGPDNGVFSYLLDREPNAVVREVTERRFFRPTVSTTFHGRDIFAPLGAALARGVNSATLGPPVADPRRLPPLEPHLSGDRIRGRVLHVDRFGNCVTNLTEALLADGAVRVHGRGGEIELREIRTTYAGAIPGAPFLIIGSSGFVEVSVNGASAAEALGIRRSDPVEVVRRSSLEATDGSKAGEQG